MALVNSIRETGGRPRIFHTDCGGAYMSNDLKKFLDEKQIVHSHRAEGDPHFDNQVIERLNRKIWDELIALGFIQTNKIFLLRA